VRLFLDVYNTIMWKNDKYLDSRILNLMIVKIIRFYVTRFGIHWETLRNEPMRTAYSRKTDRLAGKLFSIEQEKRTTLFFILISKCQ